MNIWSNIRNKIVIERSFYKIIDEKVKGKSINILQKVNMKYESISRE